MLLSSFDSNVMMSGNLTVISDYSFSLSFFGGKKFMCQSQRNIVIVRDYLFYPLNEAATLRIFVTTIKKKEKHDGKKM